MLERFLQNKETKELTKTEQKNINVADDGPEPNCYNSATDKFYAC